MIFRLLKTGHCRDVLESYNSTVVKFPSVEFLNIATLRPTSRRSLGLFFSVFLNVVALQRGLIFFFDKEFLS